MSLIFAKVQQWFEADYQRLHEGQNPLRGYAVLLVAVVCALMVSFYWVQHPVQEVLHQSGRVVSVKQNSSEITLNIPPTWASRINPGLTVHFTDNKGNRITSHITALTPVLEEKTQEPQLQATVICEPCELTFSQSVSLHVVTAKRSMLDMLGQTFITSNAGK
ncbi:hypothetical protein KIH87_05065 [Paraneptunicella aestuarii]|uniref:hypothetical protein n=1 Tax=Paraneptunicella aestuarii TaxID=2831148 RepID=UPI001E355B9E|nr:hypothetical protein [Paraneptunicella aestuarii]UAA39732.1 hypothetical protein KIH87_05065 [Paraneptunicella aestuarii]